MNVKNGLSDLIEIWMAACFEKAIQKKEESRKPTRIQRQTTPDSKQATKSHQR